MITRPRRSLPLVAALLVTSSVATAQVSFDFSTAPSPAFTTAGTTWTLDTTAGTFSTVLGNNIASTASITQSELGGSAATALDFTASSRFTLNSIGDSGTNTIGFGLLGTDATFSGGASNPFYLVDVGRSGALRILELGSATTTIATGSIGENLVGGQTYTLTLSATYLDSNSDLTNDSISLTASLFKGTTLLATVTGTDATPLVGTQFGYRLRTPNSTGFSGINVAFDDFTITAIPEPAAAAVYVGLGFLGFAAMRRRRR